MEKIFCCAIVLSISFLCAAQMESVDDGAKIVMFWNVENFFDPFDDPLTNDEDFVFGGKYKWSWNKFTHKRNAIAKGILSIKGSYGSFPMIVGLCEVENYLVLKQLVENTPLSKVGYGIVHISSRDPRGVDVALLYQKELFKVVSHRGIKVETDPPTRDILYVQGVIKDSGDTLHLFVNHWPSKLGGEKVSQPRRVAAAFALQGALDSLGEGRKVIIMGDFNDTPDRMPSSLSNLNNLAYSYFKNGRGTIRYRGDWEMIDQFIISEVLAQNAQMTIFSPPFLSEEDKTYLGLKPKRTHIGPRYNGGVSDHYPIVLKIN